MEIKIPEKMFDRPQDWKNIALVYALDRHTFGIASGWKGCSSWGSVALRIRPSTLQRKDKTLIIPIPASFVQFYDLEHEKYTIGVNGNMVLVTVHGLTIYRLCPQCGKRRKAPVRKVT